LSTNEPGYKALKVVLDGSVAAVSDNVINLRNIQPTPYDAGIHANNLDTQYIGEKGIRN